MPTGNWVDRPPSRGSKLSFGLATSLYGDFFTVPDSLPSFETMGICHGPASIHDSR